MEWLLGYPARAWSQLDAFFSWQYWWAFLAIVALLCFGMGWTAKRWERSPSHSPVWAFLAILSGVLVTVAYIGLAEKFGFTPPGVLTVVSLIAGAKGVSVGGGITFGNALREWRGWVRQARDHQ